MDTKVVDGAGDAKHLSRNGRVLLAAILTAAAAVGALALFQPSASPAGPSAAVSGAGAPLVSPAREMFEQHEDLAKSAEAAAALVATTQRQEELKDLWLERRIGTAGVSKSASAGPIPECDAVCLNAYSQQFRDLQQELNGRPAPMPACNEACLNLYGRQFQDLQFELHGR